MPAEPLPGLRERKRLATRRAIQLSVLRLATEKGLENVTVDEISTDADVSPRTFFNYFPSKEAALVGDGPVLPAADELDHFMHAGRAADVLDGIGEIMASAVENAPQDREAIRLRQALHRKHPHLSMLRLATMRTFEAELQDLIEHRLTVDLPELDAAALASRAQLIAFLATATMRHAWLSWADADVTEPLANRMRASFRELDSLRVSAPV